MNCLVIGGTGTISEGIAKAALNKHYEVTVLNRGNNSIRVPIGASVIRGDYNDIALTEKQLSGLFFDIIVDPLTYGVKDLKERIKLLENHCGLYVFISSAAAIGAGEGLRDENSPKNPVWSYGLNKLQCEKYIQEHKFKCDYLIIRPSITYGDIRIPVPVACRENPWTLIDRIEKDKPIICFRYRDRNKTTHNLMNIKDFSEYAVGLFDKDIARNNDYIICSDHLFDWEYAYDTLYRVLNKEKHIYEIDREVFKFMNLSLYQDIIYDKDSVGVNYSNAKVKHDTGIDLNEISLEDGISSLVAYLRENYKNRPLEDEYNFMTDTILLCGVNNKDDFLKKYIDGLNDEYKKGLKKIWYNRKIKRILIAMLSLER